MEKIPIEQIINVNNAKLLRDLDETLFTIEILDITEIADKLENRLFILIRHTLNENATFIHPTSVSKSNSLYDIVINQKRFEILIQKNILKPAELQVSFINIDLKEHTLKYVEREFKLEESGNYEALKIFLPEKSGIKYELVKELIQATLSTCYNWLKQQIYRLSSNNCIAASNLYLYIKKIFPSETIWSSIWLYTLKDGKIFYLLDQRVIEAAIEYCKVVAKQVDKNPLRLISELLVMKLPINETNTKKTMADGSCVDFSMEKSSYVDTHSLLTIAITGALGDDHSSIMPLMSEGRNFLFATFPTRHRKDIEPVLSLHKESIQDIYKFYNSKILSVWNSLKNTTNKLHFGQFGEFVGGFFKAWTGD